MLIYIHLVTGLSVTGMHKVKKLLTVFHWLFLKIITVALTTGQHYCAACD